MKKLIILFMLFSYNANASSPDLITSVYKLFEENYIKENQLIPLAIASLKSLKKIDNNITIADDDKKISIYYKGKKINVSTKPSQNDYRTWATFTQEVINKASKASPILNKNKFKIAELMFNISINNFDAPNNKFYKQTSPKDYRLNHQKTFSTSIKNNRLYIKAQNINPTTKNSISEVIKRNPNAKELVIDLENNSGGDIKSASEILDLFIDEGIIFTTKNKNNVINMHQAKSGDIFNHKPIYILVNKNTASAAELIAFAMQQTGRAKIIGTKTFGKNSIQTLYIIQGKGLAITTDYFYDPDLKTPVIIPQYQQIP